MSPPHDTTPEPTDHRPPTAGADVGPTRPVELVDWARTGRRVRRSALLVGAVVLAGWLVAGLLAGGPTVAGLAGWLGLGLGLLFVAEVVVVGGAAVRGMLRAGERGERLAGGDVGLLPTRRRR